MTDAATTWALVVGIDRYDFPRLRQLEGAVGDAIAAVRWLLSLGVPAEQILLHASPTQASEQPLKDLLTEMQRPSYLAATEPAIWASVDQLRNGSGSRLFVFLAGHGLYDPETRRMFLTQEAGVASAWVNLGLDEYLELFLSMDYPTQFVFLDGCQNYPYADSTRPTVKAAMHAGVTGYTARPGNRLAVCYAASQDQRAAEIEGRGAFLRRLLPAIDPKDPFLRAVDLDFTSGRRTLDLWKVMHEFVIPTVERDAGALVPPVVQRPMIEVAGAGAAPGGAIPVYELPEVPTSEITLAVEPAAAHEALESVRVADADKPFWDLFLDASAGDTIPAPLVLRLPRGRRVRADCRVRSDAPWDLATATWDLDTSRDQVRPIRFEARAPAPVATPPVEGAPPVFEGSAPTAAAERHSIQTYAPDGSLVSGVQYHEAALRLGLPGVPNSGSELAPGVRIILHETGPELEFAPDSSETGLRLLAEWTEAIRATADPALAVLTGVRGTVPQAETPNLRLVLPEGGARALAGVLAEMPSVAIGRSLPDTEVWRSGSGRSLGAVERHPALRVDPGPVHVRIDLPWGSWTEVVSAPASGEAVIGLPDTIGTPPLRVALSTLASRRWTVLGAGTDEGTASGTVALGLGRRGRRALARIDPGIARWGLGVTIPAEASATAIVTLAGTPRVRFPIRAGWPLAVERRGGGVRVEPLSEIPTPEWDMLVASGRLDALTPEQAAQLADQKWFDEILGLAGAYAVYAARDWRFLEIVLGNLGHLPNAGLDVDLLAIAMRNPDGKGLDDEAIMRLERAGAAGEVPALRWGVPLAQALLDRAGRRKGLVSWRRALDRVARGLSVSSVWTAWLDAR